jgi:hypothetical protein
MSPFRNTEQDFTIQSTKSSLTFALDQEWPVAAG